MMPFVHFATLEYKNGVLSPFWVCLFFVLAMHYKDYLCLLIFLSLSDVYHRKEAVFSAVVYWRRSLHLSFLLSQKHPNKKFNFFSTNNQLMNRPLSKIPQYSLFVPPKFCMSVYIAFIFSWDHSKTQEKMETMFMQNFGGTKSIMIFLKVAYYH